MAAAPPSGLRGLRLSTAVWQPDGLDLASLATERSEAIAERNKALEVDAEYFRKKKALRQANVLAVSSSASAPRGGHRELSGGGGSGSGEFADEFAKEFGANLGFQEPAPLPLRSRRAWEQLAELEPEPEPEPALDELRATEPASQPSAACGAEPTRDLVWLLDECMQSLVSMGLYDADELQAAEVVIKAKRLLSSSSADEEIQGEMLDLLGFERLDFISELLAHRSKLSQLSVPSQPKKLVKSAEKKRASAPRPPSVGAGGAEHARFVEQSREAFDRPAAAPGPLKQMGWSDGVNALIGGGLALPANAVQSQHKHHEEWEIPPTPTVESVRRATGAESDIPLVLVKTLPRFAQKALHPIPSLNRLQSSCFRSAFESSENLLVCAPTGSGKTNVAMLTLLREVGRHIGRDGRIRPDAEPFKIVYLAPLKALATEVTTKFSRALSVLGVRVKELTGDTKLSRAEIAKTHILVATPEKWDVMTRKSGDVALTSQLRLLIIDEVHLLHEERGAVLETLVVRTLRQVEQTQCMIRIVALSATLPNYRDVAVFLKVNEETGLFFFGPEYRPVPLSQNFVGIKKQQNPWAEKQIMNEIAWRKVAASVQEGNQCLVFVHARNDTVRTAQDFLKMMREEGKDFSAKDECETWDIEAKKVAGSRNAEMKELFLSGLGTHHAGMLRADRLLMERNFEKGLVKILVSTSTLAWGVNLPAHTVVIKGTQIYDSKAGGFVEMSMQDVHQCFGRAGRPQYDTSGEGIIITKHDKLAHYLKLLNTGLPIESQYLAALSNHLNAEVVLGNITSIDEAVTWLQYTYLWTRAMRSPNPLEYGITIAERRNDPELFAWRTKMIAHTAKKLFASRMIVYVEATGQIRSTALGRVASHFYVDHGTVESFTDPTTGVSEYMEDADILALLGQASEFSGVKVRQEELEELDGLANTGCEITPIKGGVEHAHGKVNVLLQSYLSQSRIKSFSLVIDQMYVAREAGRLLRALFEMTFFSLARATHAPYKGWVDTAISILAICKALEHRCWYTRHPLSQLAGQPGVMPDVLHRLDSHAGWVEVDELRSMTAAQLESHFSTGKISRLRTPELARSVSFLPVLRIDTELRPISRIQTATEGEVVVVRVDVFLSSDSTWSSRLHGSAESWLVYVQDDKQRLVHFESVTLRKEEQDNQAGEAGQAQHLRFHLQIPDPCPPPFFLFAESDSWVGIHSVAEIGFEDLVLPRSPGAHTVISPEAKPLPLAQAFQGNVQLEAALASGGLGLSCSGGVGGQPVEFNTVMSHVFEPLYNGDSNLLIAAAAGNGQSTCAELAIARALGTPSAQQRPQVLYLTAKYATVAVRAADWQERLGGLLGYKVAALSDGDGKLLSRTQLSDADVICCSAAQWERVIRQEKPGSAGAIPAAPPRLSLIIVDEVELLGDGGAGDAAGDAGLMELALSRWLPDATAAGSGGKIRVVGLAGAALATDSAQDLASWLGVDAEGGVFNFSNGVRPTPQELIVKKFEEKKHTPRLSSMNKPVFQTLSEHRTKQRQQQQRDGGDERCGGGALVFVSSRSQCWLTAIDLIALATASRGGVGQFTTEGNAAVLDGRLSQHRSSIKGTLRWGVGLYYGGMPRADRQLVASLWKDGLLHVLIATPDLAYATLERDFCAPLVIIKGTERYNGTKQCFEAYQQSAVLQMIGRAARRRPIGQGMGAAAAVGGGAAAGGGAAKEKEEEKVTVVVMCQVIPDAAALPPVVFCQLSCSASRLLIPSVFSALTCIIIVWVGLDGLQDILKDFWVSALFFPMPLESSLRPLLPTAEPNEDAMRKLLDGSFLSRRIVSNPSYYIADVQGGVEEGCAAEVMLAERSAAAADAAAAK